MSFWGRCADIQFTMHTSTTAYQKRYLGSAFHDTEHICLMRRAWNGFI